AVNGPSAVLVAGEVGPLEALERSLSARGVFARRVKVDYASHCGQMDALRGPLLEELAGVEARAGAVALASTVTGEVTDGSGLDAAYWADNLRQTVRFDAAINRLLQEGVRLFVEVSPHPVLVPALEGLVRGVEGAAVVGSTRREQPERARLLESLGALYAHGASIAWERLHEGRGPLAELPTYAFRRERFWLEAPARAASKRGGHPLLGEGREVSTEAGGWLFEAAVDGAGSFGEHRVRGAALLPAAAFVEMALEAGQRAFGGPCELRDLQLQQPLVLGESSRRVQAVVRGEGALVISSRGEGESGWTTHAKAELRRVDTASLPEPLPTEGVAGQAERRLDADGFYAALSARGLEYGPAFRGLSDLYAGEGRARARLRRSDRVRREQRSYGWHPALLDAALQATGACVEDGRTWVPASLGRVRAAPGGDARASQVRAHVTPAGPDRYEGVVQVVDEGGRVLLAVEGLQLAPLREGEGDPTGAWMHHTRWAPLSPPNEPAAATGTWVVLADRGGFGGRLALRLEAQGAVVKVVEPGTLDPREPESIRRFLHDTFDGGRRPCHAIVHAWALDGAASADSDLADLMAEQDYGSIAVTYLVQAMAQTPWRDAPRLWVLTRDAVAVAGSGGGAIGQASVWGLARTLAYEHAELRGTVVDLDPAGADDELAARLLAAGGSDEMVALRAGQAYAARLAAGLPERSDATAPAGERPYRLETEGPGTLEALTLRAFSPEEPGPDEVQIEVRAAGLNFLDVLSAMGLRPDQPPGAVRLGGECAGVVTRVGERVRGVSPGDEVVAVVPGAMATHVTTKAVFVAPKPRKISFEDAAALPLVYMTAWYALSHLARLERGEKVLIHAATGGVGLAAIAIARKLGAEIYATAGRPEKRAYLESSGLAAERIMSSRGPEFGAELLARTGGKGVDVVLNCLTGEAIAAGLDALAPYGRFLEIGKRDIYGGTKVELSPFRKNLSYFAIDLARLMLERPEKMGGLLREVMALVEGGELPALPTRAFAAGEAAEAFRLMAEAKHIGKLCVTFGDKGVPIREAAPAFVVRPDATYLITGGLGGLGLVLAERLVERGARHLALVGRRPPSAEASAALERLRARGAEVRTFEADVGRARDVAAVVGAVRATMPPLRGLVHAAAVL
ncbi:MAG TPA: SDR family NAD(P)-dependent oxidoreductase, partial [Polyangiaceae bacterium]|nr:SDR family NAD(P)-dependent oxidoreductase [Polyangiaceae bacterium]